MKINVSALTSLSQGQLLDAVVPCQTTPNFFRLVIAAAERLDAQGGELATDEPTLMTFLQELAEEAVKGLPQGQLAQELASLRAEELRHDLRPVVAFRLVNWQSLSVVDNLRLTLEGVYMALLHTLLIKRPGSKCK